MLPFKSIIFSEYKPSLKNFDIVYSHFLIKIIMNNFYENEFKIV